MIEIIFLITGTIFYISGTNLYKKAQDTQRDVKDDHMETIQARKDILNHLEDHNKLIRDIQIERQQKEHWKSIAIEREEQLKDKILK